MYFGHRTTNTVTNRIQLDYLKYVLRAFMLTVYKYFKIGYFNTVLSCI